MRLKAILAKADAGSAWPLDSLRSQAQARFFSQYRLGIEIRAGFDILFLCSTATRMLGEVVFTF